MLKIRLARIGKKKKPMYRIIISESSRDTYGKFLELLGHYNPFSKVCEVKKDRVLYWISKGAQLSPTVHNLMVEQNVITEGKVKAFYPKKKKKGEGEEDKPAEKPAEEKKEEKPVEKVEEKKESASAEATADKEDKPADEKKSEEKKEEKPAEEKKEDKPEEKKE